jgi:hypothetical protein
MPSNHSEAAQVDAAKMMVAETEKRVNIGSEHRELADVIGILSEVHTQGLQKYPILVIFFTGSGSPPDCIRMKRQPIPPSGFVLSRDFPERFGQALAINPAVHDGAVAFARSGLSDPYKCTGWSYLICARAYLDTADCNRGAAYNSAMFLSASPGIDCVALFSAAELEVFVNGKRAVKF